MPPPDDITFTVEFTDDQSVRYEDETKPVKLIAEGLDFEAMLALSWHLETTAENQVDGRLLEMLGRFLFEFLFPARSSIARQRRERFITLCDSKKVRVNLQFRPKARRFAQLPWEFLVVPGQQAEKFIAEYGEVSVTLFRFLSTQRRLDKVPGDLRVLVDVNSPDDKATISFAELDTTLNKLNSEARGHLVLKICRDRTLQEMRDDIAAWKPDIFHWCGHGTTKNALWLARQPPGFDLGRVQAAGVPLGFGPVADTTSVEKSIAGISTLFDGKWQPQLVILDGCHTDWSWQAELLPGVAHQLVEYVPSVIAMRYAISNAASQKFSAKLYEGILSGMPLDEAVQSARRELRDTDEDGNRAFGTPVLYLKESESICGRLIEQGSSPPAPSPTGRPPNCPLCGGEGLWSGLRCSRCLVYFRCPSCGHGFSEYNIRGGLRACNECGKPFDDTPWLDFAQPSRSSDLALSAVTPDTLARHSGSPR